MSHTEAQRAQRFISLWASWALCEIYSVWNRIYYEWESDIKKNNRLFNKSTLILGPGFTWICLWKSLSLWAFKNQDESWTAKAYPHKLWRYNFWWRVSRGLGAWWQSYSWIEISKETGAGTFKTILTYLRLADKKLGLLLNFNEELLKDDIKRIINGYI